jgi:hypothetical protein
MFTAYIQLRFGYAALFNAHFTFAPSITLRLAGELNHDYGPLAGQIWSRHCYETIILYY